LESYSFQQVYSFETVVELLDVLLKESKVLLHKYKLVSCMLLNSQSTIVPAPLFQDTDKQTYLKFNTALDNQEAVLADTIKMLDAKNVFALPLVLKNKLSGVYPTINFHHFSSVLIDNLLAQNKNKPNKKLFVYIQPSSFQAIVIEGKNLLFYNTFNYHTPEDFIYYLLFVCEQLQLNPETIETLLLGELEKNSAYYAIAYKYIRNLKFGERPDGNDYSYQLQTLPKHFYFNLLSEYIQ
jgi:hypothetical protein